MSFEVLARKWRPQTFDEVIGQEHITRTLKKAVETGRIVHAYLFSGPRGCGKTSTARILAKVINCSNLRDGNPCDACSSCVGVMQGKNLDVMEIDGASHTGVAEVRDLQESIGYAPSQYKSKVYIIDEVHMLSTHAFNALLKTLEEPPEHVYFIFATTAPHKIPETIKSRCQRHHFKRLEIREIADQLERICEAEGYKCDKGALRLLARKAEGSMRDGESLLDQCITASAGKVLADTVKNILGLLDQEMVFSFLEKITERNPTEVLRQLDRSIDEGVDLQELAGALLEGFRDLMILAAPGDMSDLLFRSKDEIAFLKRIVPSYELPDLVTIVERLCNVTPTLKSASDPRILLESVLVDISLLDRQIDIRDLLKHVQSGKPQREAPSGSGNEGMEEDPSRSESNRSAGGEGGGGPSGGAKAAARVLNGEQALFSGLDSEILGRGPEREAAGPVSGVGDGRMRSQPQPEMPQDVSDVAILREYWDGFVTYVRQKKVSLGVCLISARLADFDGKTIRLEFPRGYLIQKEQVEKSDSVRSLKRMLEKYFRREMDIACAFASGQSRPFDDRADPEHTRKAVPGGKRVIQDQPVVKKILEDFDGEIITYRP